MKANLPRSFASATGLLSAAMLTASAANYALNLGLARLLDPAQFGDATLMVTLLLGLTAAGVALQLIAARAVSDASYDETEGIRARLASSAGRGGVLLALATAAAAPILRDVLHTESALPFVALAAGLPIYLLQSVDRGVLQGRLEFRRLAGSFAVEAVVRLVGGIAFVAIGLGVTGATAALSLSFIGSWLTVRPARSASANRAARPVAVPLGNASRATVLLLVGQIIINNGDVIWAKQLLDPETAGSYAAVALVGRAVFFCSWAVANAAFPLASADDDGAPSVLAMGIGAVTALSVVSVVAIAVIGDRLGPLMFGSSIDDIPDLFVPYAIATAMFAVANLVATVDVACGRMDTALVVVGGGILQTVLLVRFGTSPASLVDMQLVAMTVLLIVTTVVHRRRREISFPTRLAPQPVAATR